MVHHSPERGSKNSRPLGPNSISSVTGVHVPDSGVRLRFRDRKAVGTTVAPNDRHTGRKPTAGGVLGQFQVGGPRKDTVDDVLGGKKAKERN